MADEIDRDLLRKELPADSYDDFYRVGSAYDRPYWASHYYPLYCAALSEVTRLGGSSVLEVGCGSGSFAHLLLQRSSIEYHGFDFSEEAIRRARQRTGRPEWFSVDRAESNTVTQRRYDTIVCLEVLEHIERDIDVVAKWPAGKFCVCSVPNFDATGHVRFFRHEDDVFERYGRYIELQRIRRIPLALIRGRGWREYLRQLRWSRNDPARLLGMLGYRTFENVAGWLLFSGIRKDATERRPDCD